MEVEVEVEVVEEMVEEAVVVAVAARRHLQPHFDVHLDAAAPALGLGEHELAQQRRRPCRGRRHVGIIAQNCARIAPELRTLRDLRRLGARQRDARLDDAGAHRRHLVGHVVE